MKLSPVIQRLRSKCSSFQSRVAGAAEFAPLPDGVAVAMPAAIVLPAQDVAADPESMSGYIQTIRDQIAVVVVVASDERGQEAYDAIQDLRAEIFKALLGWQPEKPGSVLTYGGGGLLHLDRSRLYWQFVFELEWQVVADIAADDETAQGVDLAALSALEHVHIDVDVIDPIAFPWPGPDGRIESQIDIDLTEGD